MTRPHLHPYVGRDEVRRAIERVIPAAGPLVHPQRVIDGLRAERPMFQRFNGWLADHIVGLAGTMGFFYFLCLVMGGWALWQSWIAGDTGFDPYPYAFLFFILGGIMQSLFVPTMLTASNRVAERDRIKDETDHRAWAHLYDVNDEQLVLLRRLVDELLAGDRSSDPNPPIA
ncbi:MAG: DUF1003 domain-containing protein [Dehalococcoidia bacterium]|nr:DUF1003 domain-containing protein [Dehalococcoidia bacterium]